MAVRKEKSPPRPSRIFTAICIGVLVGCIFAILHPHGLFSTLTPKRSAPFSKSALQVLSSSRESTEAKAMTKSELADLVAKIDELKKQVMVLNEKLQLADRPKDQSSVSGDAHKDVPFNAANVLRNKPDVLADDSVNPRLTKILDEIAVRKEIIVALANSNVIYELRLWLYGIRKAGITNFLIVALDDDIVEFCKSKRVPVYQRDPDKYIDSIGKTVDNHAVSGLKFRILKEFLQLGYSVLVSDVDIVYVQNPFNFLYRDSDVESMSDGHDNMTAYGYNDVFDEPEMGWGRYAHTMRVWVFNSGFFYIRPTIPSIELLDRVANRLSNDPMSWDQAVFNEELFFPSHPGYIGLLASKRTMDFYLFMNSKVLFKTVRNDAVLKNLKPVIVHINYHPDKLIRMNAVVNFYLKGKKEALDPFPLGSE